MIKISVIVPVYNVEPYVRDCLESIVNQTYSNIEIILVDDGSTDYSGLICDEYARKDQRIIVIHKNNGGLVSARKAGISAATGDYVTYVDSDDWIDLDVFEKVINKMESNQPDIIAFGHIKEYLENPDKRPENIKDGIYSVDDIEQITKRELLKENFFYTQVLSGLVWGKLYKRNIMVKSQMAVNNAIRIGEDLAVFDRCYMQSKSVMVYSLCAYHYRIRENSLTKNISSQDYFGFLEFVKCLKDGIADRGHLRIPQRIIYDIFYQIVVCCPKKILEKSENELNLFSGVRKGSKVVIYGKGVFSKGIREYICETKYVDLAGVVDSSDKNRIFELGEFDYVLIAITNGKLVKEIKSELVRMGIESDKIVYIKNDDLRLEKLPDEVLNIFRDLL